MRGTNCRAPREAGGVRDRTGPELTVGRGGMVRAGSAWHRNRWSSTGTNGHDGKQKLQVTEHQRPAPRTAQRGEGGSKSPSGCREAPGLLPTSRRPPRTGPPPAELGAIDRRERGRSRRPCHSRARGKGTRAERNGQPRLLSWPAPLTTGSGAGSSRGTTCKLRTLTTRLCLDGDQPTSA
jgi:hypothetical protein